MANSSHASTPGATGKSALEPTSPLASSRTLGWESLLVREFQEPPCSLERSEMWQDHTIVLCLAPRPHRIHHVVGDRRYTGIYTQGDISITPAKLPISYRNEGDDRYLHVQMSPQFLQEVAREALELDSTQVELVTEFRVCNRQIKQILLMLRAELHRGEGRAGQLYVESLANVLAVSLLREYSTARLRVARYEGGLGDRKLLQVLDYINDSLDRDIKLADLAQLVGISKFHFSRLFDRSMGVSPHQYLLQQRVERAKQLLKHSQLPISDIALQCGFNSQSHLSHAFRKLTGVTPSVYRKG
ncbi:helix-turn-helix domain-containing protein [Baaleninema simplex]|uniref:helix-turn-helix domain-containing protein n=1 Tax=Baaleninema simplex TaxID=2862350 RepID=UPI000372B5BC|nr:AraC family transcriptional regulator [Baaleninema simplex]